MCSKRFTILIGISLALCQTVSAEFLQLDQTKNRYNKMQTGAGLKKHVEGTGDQFKTAIFFGSPSRKNTDPKTTWTYEEPSSGGFTLKQTRVGIAYFGRMFQYKFGSVISPPNEDENGDDLPPGQTAFTYWKPKPFNADKAKESINKEYGRFYWSAGQEKLFATRPGPVDIIWIKQTAVETRDNPKTTGRAEAGSEGTQLHTTINNGVKMLWYEQAGVFYRAYKEQIIISGSPVKPSKRIYWDTMVEIPESRIHAVNVVYNDTFPETVEDGTPLAIEGVSSTTDDGVAQQTQTLWYSSSENSLKALNREGRVFVEFLGNMVPGKNFRKSLGFEIVDVKEISSMERAEVELGEPFPVLTSVGQHAEGSNLSLFPKIANTLSGNNFVKRQFSGVNHEGATFYAIQRTFNPNDLIMWWMVEGVQGIKWPERKVSYELYWPGNPAKYSHYIRPQVDTEEAAKQTAVQLPTKNAPRIVYQDAASTPKAKLTSDYKFYTYLDGVTPIHRTLIEFTAEDNLMYERVASWLEPNVSSGEFGNGEVATSFGANDAGKITFADPSSSPRVLKENLTVTVGSRINVPTGEEGSSGEGYLAGYIKSGTSYLPDAYINPLEKGFDEANKGAIIPINAIPGHNTLDVWWFRKNLQRWLPTSEDILATQLNREQEGFEPIYWPSVIGNYTIEWPHENASYTDVSKGTTIVMASNDGSGPLNSLEAKGTVYFQNDASQPGYNPNEEHALMQGGQVYALRNDLNKTTSQDVHDISSETYSSEAYVLLSYTASDGRPDIRPFRVLQELNEIKFDYEVEAGTILQAPMPLPLMPKLDHNKEIHSSTVTEAKRFGETHALKITTEEEHPFRVGDTVHLSQFKEGPSNNGWAYVEKIVDTKTFLATKMKSNNLIPILEIDGDSHGIESSSRIKIVDVDGYSFSSVTINESEGYSTSADKQAITVEANKLDLSKGDVIHFENGGIFTLNTDPGANATTLNGVLSGRSVSNDEMGYKDSGEYEFSAVPGSQLLTTTEASGGKFFELPSSEPSDAEIDSSKPSFVKFQKPASGGLYPETTIMDRKNNIWVYRGTHTPNFPAPFTVRYYYKTLEGFWFPGRSDQPVVGTIVPYLLNDPNADWPAGSYQPRLPRAIKYSANWPTDVAELRPGQTLTTPVFGLPAVRGNTSLKILYQQAKANSSTESQNTSVTLHDPTREKVYDLATGDAGLVELPASLVTMSHKGKTYFTQLPPHLVDRLFFDPMRGQKGQLVFKGEFVDEIVGEDYLLLNVLTGKDLEDVQKLADPNKADTKWNSAIDQLTAKVETFMESANKPGSFIPDINEEDEVAAENLVEISSDETAVDSYALSANGNQSGYVTLIAGDGQAFTPEEEPVQMHVIKVGGPLYRGEAKVILSDNPLAEKVTFMHTGDLAGSTKDFDYEWRIAAPEDGLPPAVSERKPINGATAAISTTNWKHLRKVPVGNLPPVTDDSWDSVGLGVVTVQESENVSSISYILDADEKTPDDDRLDTIEITTTDSHKFKTGDTVDLVGFVPANLDRDGLKVSAVDGRTISLNIDSIDELPEVQIYGNVQESMNGVSASSPTSLLYGEFEIPAGKVPTDVFLSLTVDPNLAARVKINGSVVATRNLETIINGDADSAVSTAPNTFNPLPIVFAVDSGLLNSATSNTINVELWSDAITGAALAFNLKIEANELVDRVTAPGSKWLARENGEDLRSIIIGESADVLALSDNYIVMRYRARYPNHVTWQDTDQDTSTNEGWSRWTEPQLAEGWIKRVLAGINPFNQRTGDMFSNSVDTTGSILTQAGKRWEGDVALNMESINDYGLIEIYETVMGRGRMLSIDAGIDYGPANDALLLAAGYINDLYMMLGHEAWADAANPTIGIGTKDKTYGDIATALFSFKGQVPSLLEEELALLRGRDDFLQPGVEAAPVYNRLFWNYTRGIDSGEVIYALNYNIQEDNDSGYDGKVNAEDAYKMYPQGHGDGYGHYLTALKGYYKLLVDNDFTWVPRTEAVTILGKPVQVDYMDERKFAAAAAAVARTGRQVVDLTWRRDYQAKKEIAWEKEFSATRDNDRRTQATTRHWGLDHWASRSGQGALINWVVGNSMLPATDPDPSHEGIQKIDRTTVPELRELAAILTELQTTMDNAEAGMNPLGLNEDSIAMDINPHGGAQFEQIFERARQSLNNATLAFNSTKEMTQLMRSEQDSLADLQATTEQQELAYKYALIELYGTPYSDDIGPGKTYKQGYDGPDLYNYMYIDEPAGVQLSNEVVPIEYDETISFKIDIQGSKISDFNSIEKIREKLNRDDDVNFDLVEKWADSKVGNGSSIENEDYIVFKLDHNGYPKRDIYKGKRESPGEIQMAYSKLLQAHAEARSSFEDHQFLKYKLDREIALFESEIIKRNEVNHWHQINRYANTVYAGLKHASKMTGETLNALLKSIKAAGKTAETAVPKSTIVGMATGGDFMGAVRALKKGTQALTEANIQALKKANKFSMGLVTLADKKRKSWVQLEKIAPARWEFTLKQRVHELSLSLDTLQASVNEIYQAVELLNDAQMQINSLQAKGIRIQEEREIFRQRGAALVQGFRTRDAAFKVFRNEKLERYKALQDMAAKYAFLAAQAYDYETGLLTTPEGKEFVERIVNSRALGVVVDGEPQFAGSDTGDPGISSALAEMKNDWDILNGRLGFNNPDQYGTTVSLRAGNYRILPSENGAVQWGDVLEKARMENIMTDVDVRRHCMQVGFEDGRPVPGLVFNFRTTIEKGKNLFGKPLAGGDSQFSPASFATKIFSVGIALEGYVGMSTPNTNDQGGQSPDNPTPPWLDPTALSKTPYLYLIPVGVDSMRSPPLGDHSEIRTWNVQDVAIPLPFNIGASEHSHKKLWQSSASLTDQLFATRKHQPFRAVDSAKTFDGITIVPDQTMSQSDVTSNRLVGRSVWNSRWKLVIPGYMLLEDPEEGLDRFMQTVEDIKIFFNTYSYSGN